jgi:hypothetical protein
VVSESGGNVVLCGIREPSGCRTHVALFSAIATNSKISFIPMSSLEAGAHDRNAPGVVHFVPDGDNRRGAITCLAVSSHDEGKLQLYVLY